MLITLTTTHRPATDLGYLLHKHPDRVQSFQTGTGTAHVCYPQATENECTAALLLETDPKWRRIFETEALRIEGSISRASHSFGPATQPKPEPQPPEGSPPQQPDGG